MNKLFAVLVVILTVILFSQVFLISATTELVENSWVIRKSMPTGRMSCESVAASNGMIYVIGGYAAGLSGGNDNEMYNPATDTWTTKSSMPTSRSSFGIATYQGKIYCIGGEGGSFEDGMVTGVNEVYDIATDTWETKASMTTARGNLCANLVNGKIYLIGGSKPLNWMDLTPLPNVNEVYDIASDTWSSRTPSPVAVSSYVSAVVDDKIYVISQVSESIMLTLIYDTEADLWSYGTPCPSSMFGAGIGATTGERAPVRIYVIGGNPTFDRVSVYDPNVDTWTWGAVMLTGRYALSVAVRDDVLYAFGGAGADDHNELYVPLGYNTSALPSGSTVAPLPSDNETGYTVGILVAIIVVIAVVGVAITIVLRGKKTKSANLTLQRTLLQTTRIITVLVTKTLRKILFLNTTTNATSNYIRYSLFYP
ncbi:MAG: hypothetical protein FWC30_01870 [Candidatus Bathyarchaeota archaeon]|nr:hypothetical protein [Candidatus Termiticorpusculum sp.]